MNGQNPNNQSELTGSVLGTVGPVPAATPVPPVNNVEPTPVPNVGQSMAPVSPVGPMPTEVAPTTPAAEVVTPQVTEVPVTPQATVNPTPQPTSVVPPVTSNTNTVATPVTPQAVPIPGTENLTANTVGSGTPNVGQNANSNGFFNAKKNENIGGIPPQNEETKKKPMNKIMVIVVMVVLIIAVAFGVYYFLSISNNKVKLNMRVVTIGVNSTLSENVSDYANVVKGNVNACRVNKTKVDVKKVGQYEVTITCGEEVFKGTVIVADMEAPKLVLKPAFVKVYSDIKVDDLVVSCEDDSECKKEIVDEAKFKENLTTVGGPYKVEVKAEDSVGNATTEETYLYVTAEDIDMYTYFVSTNEQMVDKPIVKSVIDVLLFNQKESGEYSFINVARRNYKYAFTTENDYKEAIGEKGSTIVFDNISGDAIYDDEKHVLIISTNLTLDNLKEENGGSFPENYVDIKNNVYNADKGYNSSNKVSYVVDPE